MVNKKGDSKLVWSAAYLRNTETKNQRLRCIQCRQLLVQNSCISRSV